MELETLEQKKTASVLIVEDDMIHSFIAQTCLKDHFHVEAVSNGHAALEAVKHMKFDIVLMDINLNDHTLDGIQTMRKMKYDRKNRHTKIVAVTASSDAKEWFLKEGFDGHYMKPVIEESIITEINSQLAKQVKYKQAAFSTN